MNIPILIIIVGIFFMIWASKHKRFKKRIILINIGIIVLYTVVFWGHQFSEMDKGKGDMSWMLIMLTITIIHVVLLIVYALLTTFRNK